MALWVKLLILWFIIGTIINFYMRRKLQKYYLKAFDDVHLYREGFKDGASATKLYQTLLGKLPSSNWIDSNCGNKLSTREELIATLDEDDTKNVNLVT